MTAMEPSVFFKNDRLVFMVVALGFDLAGVLILAVVKSYFLSSHMLLLSLFGYCFSIGHFADNSEKW